MTSKDANKENEGGGASSSAAAAAANPALGKNVVIYSTDMAEELRQSIVRVAHRAFHAPVNHGKVYRTIANLIRTECEKEFDGANGGPGGAGAAAGGGDGGGAGDESSGGAGGAEGGTAVGSSGGWCCVVGDAFGSSVTHRMKTYIHFSVVPRVNVLLWKS